MKPPGTRTNERSETDVSLRVERARTDEELAAARADIDADADHVLDLARKRAAALLQLTRERTDDDLVKRGVSDSVRRGIREERRDADRARADEQTIADRQLHEEREASQHALSTSLQREREQTDRRLSDERTRADEALVARDDFLAMVIHDQRSLLGAIMLHANMLAKDARAEGEAGLARLRQLQSIQRSSEQLNHLMQDLLDIARIDAGKLVVSPRLCDAGQLARDAIDVFQLPYSVKGLTLASRIAAGKLLAVLDPARILQVLANLLTNALKFTGAGGHVSVVVEPVDADVRVSVIDTGVGIPDDELECVFERYRQVRSADRRGLGLGLYIARCIVRAHGGEIWAERSDAGGTAVHCRLPGMTAEPA